MSLSLGLRKPLQNGKSKVPTSFCSAGSPPSLHPPQHLQVSQTPHPRLHSCLGCIFVL